MAKLHIFGDSYSTPDFLVKPSESWWGLMAHDLGNKITKVENWSWPGNNIDSIAHIIVSEISQFRPDDYIVIGVPPLQRLTMFAPENDIQPKKVIFSRDFIRQDSIDISCHRGLAQYSVHQMDKKFVDLWNVSWVEAQALRSLILLDDFLSHRTHKTVFLNLSVPLQPLTDWPTLGSLQKMCQKENMLLFENTYYSVNLEKHRPVDFETFGWMGHHGKEGNKHWYDLAVRPMIQHLGWI
jgi:hypothetical protein